MDLKLNIRPADNDDREKYADLAVALSRFNRAYYDAQCGYDDCDSVLAAVRKRAVKVFDSAVAEGEEDPQSEAACVFLESIRA